MNDIGLLLLRLGAPFLLLYKHGWAKLVNFSFLAATFPDPLHVGRKLSLALAVFGEVVCPLAVILGFMTRLAALPAAVTMLVAAFVVDRRGWLGNELALLYLVSFLAIALTGPGAYSIDWMVRKRR